LCGWHVMGVVPHSKHLQNDDNTITSQHVSIALRKRSAMYSPLVPLLVIFIGFSFSGYSDISWEQIDRVNESGTTTTTTQKISIAGTKFALENDKGFRIILDLNNDTLTTLDLNEKTYTTTTFREISSIRKHYYEMTDSIINDALKNIPDEERSMYKQLLEKRMKTQGTSDTTSQDNRPHYADYKPTGKIKTILGSLSSQYRAMGSDSTLYEIWCTTGISTGEIQNFYKRLQAKGEFTTMRKDVTVLTFGFPLKSSESKKGYFSTSDVSSVSYQAIPASTFTIPEEFTRSLEYQNPDPEEEK
jgi:hypothetical protein